MGGTAPEFAADGVAIGRHKFTLTSPDGQATAEFEVASGRLPVMDGPVQTKHVNAVLLSQFGARAWPYSSEPLPVAATLRVNALFWEIANVAGGCVVIATGVGV